MSIFRIIGLLTICFCISCSSNSHRDGENIDFLGTIIKSMTEGKIEEKEGKQFVKVIVELYPYKINEGNLKIGERQEIIFHVIANSGEPLKIDKQSLLMWDFHKSNKLHVQAVYEKGHFIEEVNSVQDNPCIE